MNKYEAAKALELEIAKALDAFGGAAAQADDLSVDQWLDCLSFKQRLMDEVAGFFESIGALCPDCQTVGQHNHEQKGV